MAIIPCGFRVIVRQDDHTEVDPVYAAAKAVGIEFAFDKNTRYQESVDKGVITAIGPTAWKDYGDQPWASVGDTIYFARNAGKRVEDPSDPDKHYLALNDEDVVCVIKE